MSRSQFKEFIKFNRNTNTIIASHQDNFIPSYHSREIQNQIPQSRIDIIEGGCHNMLVEQPNKTHFFINDFLKQFI
jgi:3-oxoadipate enol-lactonase